MSGTQTGQPETKAALLARIAESWAALQGAIGKLTHEQLLAPDATSGWTLKDELYHLAAWQQYQLARMRGTLSAATVGIDEEAFSSGDIDAENEAFQRKGQPLPLGEVLAALELAYRDLVTEIERMPDETLFGPAYPDDPQSRRVIDYVAGNTYEHFDEHRATIEGVTA